MTPYLLPYNVHRHFERGMQAAAFIVARGPCRLIHDEPPEVAARRDDCRLQREVKAFTDGYRIASDPRFIEPWKAGRNLTNFAIDAGLVEPVKWRFHNGYVEVTP